MTSHTAILNVKTDLNFGGWPERLVNSSIATRITLRARRALGLTGNKILYKDDYRIYPDSGSVSPDLRHDERYLVEKFLPQRCGQGWNTGFYVLLI